jgi:hypothetical protein
MGFSKGSARLALPAQCVSDSLQSTARAGANYGIYVTVSLAIAAPTVFLLQDLGVYSKPARTHHWR